MNPLFTVEHCYGGNDADNALHTDNVFLVTQPLGKGLIFIDDVTNNGSSKMNSEVYKHFVCQFKERCNQTDWEILHHAAR